MGKTAYFCSQLRCKVTEFRELSQIFFKNPQEGNNFRNFGRLWAF